MPKIYKSSTTSPERTLQDKEFYKAFNLKPKVETPEESKAAWQKLIAENTARELEQGKKV